MILLSAAGTFRLILILLIVFLVLRMIARSRQGPPGKRTGGFNWTRPEQRPKGDVRIERSGDEKRSGSGPVEDADFEEVR